MVLGLVGVVLSTRYFCTGVLSVRSTRVNLFAVGIRTSSIFNTLLGRIRSDSHDDVSQEREKVSQQWLCEVVRYHAFSGAVGHGDLFSLEDVLNEKISDVDVSRFLSA